MPAPQTSFIENDEDKINYKLQSLYLKTYFLFDKKELSDVTIRKHKMNFFMTKLF